MDFETVALSELPVLYRVARRMTLDPTNAEDLVGQALLLAAKAWNDFDGRHVRSWLLKILKNAHLNSIRRSAVRPTTVSFEDTEPSDEGFWREVSWRAVGADLLVELDRLPEEYRLAVALCDVEEMSYEEAAEAMEVPTGTVRSRLFRGRRLLRARLAKAVDNDESGWQCATDVRKELR